MRSLCRFHIWVNHTLVRIFNITNLSFSAIREYIFFEKKSEFTVVHHPCLSSTLAE